MGKYIDLNGRRFGRLLVLGRGKNRGRRITWLCQCTCGRKKLLVADYLRSKKSRSCGCLRNEVTQKRFTTHGDTLGRRPTKEYRAWCHIKGRCYNSEDARYSSCGGRGIKMCRPWQNSFSTFLRDMGRAPPNTILKRLDLDRNYEPGNCFWQKKPPVKARKPKLQRRPSHQTMTANARIGFASHKGP
jgi:hypothetical protein